MCRRYLLDFTRCRTTDGRLLRTEIWSGIWHLLWHISWLEGCIPRGTVKKKLRASRAWCVIRQWLKWSEEEKKWRGDEKVGGIRWDGMGEEVNWNSGYLRKWWLVCSMMDCRDKGEAAFIWENSEGCVLSVILHPNMRLGCEHIPIRYFV